MWLSFLDLVYLGCTYSTWMQTTYFSWSNRKITWVWKTSRKNSNLVLRYEHMRKSALRETDKNWAIEQ